MIVIIVSVTLYIWWTVTITEIQRKVRKEMNQKDGEASGRALDSLLNFETVKYFNAEEREIAEYGSALDNYFRFTEKSQRIVSVLNTGQGLLISICVGAAMYFMSQEIVREL